MRDMKSKPEFLPPAIPKDLADRIIRLHGDPVVWWVGQFLKYILRPKDNTLQYLEQNKNLRTLDIRSCDKLTLKGVSQLLKAVKLKALITNNNSILSDQFILRHECDNFSMQQALVLPLPFKFSNL